MKLALAILAYLVIGAVLGVGILMMIAGKPWLLIAATLIYIAMFFKIGCLTH